MAKSASFLQNLRKRGFALRNLVQEFDADPPPWMAKIPLWLFAIAIIVGPMIGKIVPAWMSLPVPYGTLIGPADPDPWLRLTLVRDWLMGGSWYSHLMLASNAPWGGISSPWTRPLDIVIALLVKLQFHSAPLTIELVRAALVLPLIWMGLLITGLYRILRTLGAAPVSVFLVTALMLAMPPIWNYFGEGNADHHAPLAALWVWALGFLLKPQPRTRDLWIAGLLLALMLWISPEALMLIASIYIFYGLAWLLADPVGDRLTPLATAAALGTTVFMLIERQPGEWFHAYYDTISVVHVLLLSLTALLCWALRWFSPQVPVIRERLIVAGFGATCVLIAMHKIFPLFFHGPMAEADPFIMTSFLPRITEAEPLFAERPLDVIAMLIQPFFAIGVCLIQLLRREGIYSQANAAFIAFLTLMTLSLYCVEQRWFYYLYPLVVIALAPWLAALFTPKHTSVAKFLPARKLNRLPEEKQLLLRLPVLTAIFIVPILLMLSLPDKSSPSSRRIDACQKEARVLIYGGKLDEMAGGRSLNFLTSTDLSGEIFFWSKQHVVAGNYHREGPGIRYVWEANKVKTAPELKRYLAQRDIGALLICPDSRPPKDSLLLGLQRGDRKPPAWLKPVAYPTEVKKSARPALFLVQPTSPAE